MIKAYVWGVVVMFAVAGLAAADLPKDGAEDAESLRKQLHDDPNNATALEAFVKVQLRRLDPLVDSRPDEADREIKAIDAFLMALEPDNEQSKQQIARARSRFALYAKRIELSRTSFDELTQRITANADDLQSVNTFVMKVLTKASPMVHTKPDEAEAQLRAGRTVLETAKRQAKQEATKLHIERTLQRFAVLEREVATGRKRIDWGKKLTALIGTPTIPLTAAAWVNGPPLKDADLKGKVILLNFYAVWANECMEMFPHLRKWNDKYADQGLIIVGVTKYYDFTWDETAKRAVKSSQKIAAAEEDKMLARFAEHYELPYRFAVQSDAQLYDKFGAHAIPYAVLIDRRGIIRSVRIGRDSNAARDIEDVLEKLIAEKE